MCVSSNRPKFAYLYELGKLQHIIINKTSIFKNQPRYDTKISVRVRKVLEEEGEENRRKKRIFPPKLRYAPE